MATLKPVSTMERGIVLSIAQAESDPYRCTST